MHIVTAEEELRHFEMASRNKNLYDLAKLMLLQGNRPEEVLSLKKCSYNREKARRSVSKTGTTPLRGVDHDNREPNEIGGPVAIS
jgi:hypothetical protein